MTHRDRVHRKYSASNAHRILHCPGQVAYCATLPPRPDSEASEEGTRAHELLETYFLGIRPHQDDADRETREAVQVALDYIEGVVIKQGHSLRLYTEYYSRFPQSVVPPEDAGGYLDVGLIDDTTNELWVIEYKHGAGVFVPAVGNEQLLFNATGISWTRPFARIHCVVIQPRILWHGPVVREWTIDMLDVIEFQARMERAIAIADRCGQPDTLKPGEHCRFCPGEAMCQAREKGALSVVGARSISSFVPPPPPSLGLGRLSEILLRADEIKSWLKACESYAYDSAMQNVKVPGYKLVEAQDRRTVTATPREIAATLTEIAGHYVGEDEVTERETLGVTALDKLVTKLARDAAPAGQKDAAVKAARDKFAFLTSKASSGKLSLVPETDPRPAVNRAQAMFKGVAIPALPTGE